MCGGQPLVVLCSLLMLYLCYVFRALINSIVCWYCTNSYHTAIHVCLPPLFFPFLPPPPPPHPALSFFFSILTAYPICICCILHIVKRYRYHSTYVKTRTAFVTPSRDAGVATIRTLRSEQNVCFYTSQAVRIAFSQNNLNDISSRYWNPRYIPNVTLSPPDWFCIKMGVTTCELKQSPCLHVKWRRVIPDSPSLALSLCSDVTCSGSDVAYVTSCVNRRRYPNCKWNDV